MRAAQAERKAVIGQDPILSFLHSTVQRGRVSSAYIFHGPNAVGKRTTAKLFLQSLLCLNGEVLSPCGSCSSCLLWERGAHPDALLINMHDDTAVGIDVVRAAQKQLSYRPSVGGYRIVLIGNADTMTLEAANALLKTLEEPPAMTVIILCVTSISSLPLTVRSRCQQLGFQLVPQEAIFQLLRNRTDSVERARNLSHVAIGRPGLALNLLSRPEEFEDYERRVRSLLSLFRSPLAQRMQRVPELLPTTLPPKKAREEMVLLLDLWIWLFRDAIFLQEQQPEFLVHRFLQDELQAIGEKFSSAALLTRIRDLERMKFLLLRNNANPQLVFEHSLISL